MKRPLLLLFTALTITATAQNAADSIRILFVGNSYTYYNKLPEMVARIAREANEGNRLPLACSMRAPGGWSLKRHAASAETWHAIESKAWQYVVLQDQSAAPAWPTDVVARNSYPYASTLDSLVHRRNPKAKTIFYMTWGHRDSCQEAHDNYPILNTYSGMQMRLATSYLEMAYRNHSLCSPVGLVWQKVRQDRPDINLYSSDGSHPSTAGSFLAANVFYAVILGRPFTTTYNAGLNPEIADYLSRTAQQYVFSHERLINLPARP